MKTFDDVPQRVRTWAAEAIKEGWEPFEVFDTGFVSRREKVVGTSTDQPKVVYPVDSPLYQMFQEGFQQGV